MHGITPMMPHRLLNQAVPTEGLIRINFRNEVLINKKIGDQYVRIGADSEILLFNRNYDLFFVCCLFVVYWGEYGNNQQFLGVRLALRAAPACCSCASFPTSPVMSTAPSNVRGVRMRLRKSFNPWMRPEHSRACCRGRFHENGRRVSRDGRRMFQMGA